MVILLNLITVGWPLNCKITSSRKMYIVALKEGPLKYNQTKKLQEISAKFTTVLNWPAAG